MVKIRNDWAVQIIELMESNWFLISDDLIRSLVKSHNRHNPESINSQITPNVQKPWEIELPWTGKPLIAKEVLQESNYEQLATTTTTTTSTGPRTM